MYVDDYQHATALIAQRHTEAENQRRVTSLRPATRPTSPMTQTQKTRKHMKITASTKKGGLFGSRRSRPEVPSRIADALGGAFSKRQMQALGRLGTLVRVPAGRELVVQGNPGREAFVVAAGTAEVLRGGEFLAAIGTGAVFGESALFDSAPRNASVVATSALSVFVLNPAEFTSLLNECPPLDRSIRDTAARRKAELSPSVPMPSLLSSGAAA